jgi:hypothetical protein
MFIKGVSHQLKMIASVGLFIFCQYIDTRESLNTLDDVKGNTVSGKKKLRNSIVINEYQLASLYIR